MQLPSALAAALLLATLAGWLSALLLLRAWLRARGRAARLDSAKRSQSTRYGQLSEAYAPWLKDWPFRDASRFRFLGDPIDGVQFEDDAVYLVEMKAAGATLSPRQRAVRDAVLSGRVGWVTFSVREGKAVEVRRPWEER